jgi:hypothetical protein
VREGLADLRRRIRHFAHILSWGSRQVNEQTRTETNGDEQRLPAAKS